MIVRVENLMGTDGNFVNFMGVVMVRCVESVMAKWLDLSETCYKHHGPDKLKQWSLEKLHNFAKNFKYNIFYHAINKTAHGTIIVVELLASANAV